MWHPRLPTAGLAVVLLLSSARAAAAGADDDRSATEDARAVEIAPAGPVDDLQVEPGPASQPTVSGPTSAPTSAPAEAADVAEDEPAAAEGLGHGANGASGGAGGDAGDGASGARPGPASLADLARFEALTFPRGPEQTRLVLPPRPGPRPSAEHPPPELRSAHGARRVSGRPSAGWLAELQLPDLPVTWDQKVIRYLSFYREHPRGRALMQAWLQRQGRYRRMILRVLRRYGLPTSLLAVAMVESGYNPLVTSPVGAVGLWQFMYGSGKAYGLRRDFWVDERRNPERATEAAARMLRELHGRFGNWELALAAYNAGPGLVIEAMRKYNTNDYWQLCRYEAGLPWSTTLYVPKILASAIVDRNRAAFGFADLEPDAPLDFQLVAVDRSLRLTTIAEATGSSEAQLVELNPELRRGRTPPGDKVWVRVPAATAQRFYDYLARDKRLRHRPYRVKLGDSDQGIAARFGISKARFRALNGIEHSAELRPGLLILVPASTPAPAAQRPAAGEAADEQQRIVVALPEGVPVQLPDRKRVFYRVVIGDTLGEIARHLGVTVDDLAEWNGLDPEGKLVSQMVLQAFVSRRFDDRRVRLLDEAKVRVMIAGSDAFLDQHEQAKGRQRLSYTVRPGETLKRIARRFGLSVGSLMRINSFGPGTKLLAGQKIVVYTEPKRTRRLADRRRGNKKSRGAPPDKRGRRPRTYTVRPGDTLSEIGERFGISVERLRRINRMRSDVLLAGQELVVDEPRRGAGGSKGRVKPRARRSRRGSS